MPAFLPAAETTASADWSTSLSQTTIEKVKRLLVVCSWSFSNRRWSRTGRLNVQMQTVMWGVFRGRRSEIRCQASDDRGRTTEKRGQRTNDEVFSLSAFDPSKALNL